MTSSKKPWIALVPGTIVTLLSMHVGLSSLQHLRVKHGESEEDLWITSNRDLGELPLSGMAWPDVASRYRGLLTSYLAKDPSSHLHRLAAFTVGFDDGDLERVR